MNTFLFSCQVRLVVTAQGFLLMCDHYLFLFLRSLVAYTMSRLSENTVPCSLQRLLSEIGA